MPQCYHGRGGGYSARDGPSPRTTSRRADRPARGRSRVWIKVAIETCLYGHVMGLANPGYSMYSSVIRQNFGSPGMPMTGRTRHS